MAAAVHLDWKPSCELRNPIRADHTIVGGYEPRTTSRLIDTRCFAASRSRQASRGLKLGREYKVVSLPLEIITQERPQVFGYRQRASVRSRSGHDRLRDTLKQISCCALILLELGGYRTTTSASWGNSW
jgi:hypothetical protein